MPRDLCEKAGHITGVTCWTHGTSLYEEAVILAVLPDGLHLDVIAGRDSLVPHLLATATVKPDVFTGEGLVQGFLVHVTQH